MSHDLADTWLREALGLANDETPFPWQEELLGRFVRNEGVDALDLPTGLGKTSVMGIWLVARALGAPIPRRLVYVVDRRAVVDQATRVAERLRELASVNHAFNKALALEGRRLPISTLRGQHVDNRAWLEDPTTPAIVVGTVDMVGSRLLFEGYGVSRKMRPYHAGLLGADTLIVLDEAHLVPPFQCLLESVTEGTTLGPTGVERCALVPRLRLLCLSATGRVRTPERTLTLRAKDREHPVVKKRIHAKKVVSRRTVGDAKELAPELARAAWDLAEQGRQPARVIVFCNRRTDAITTHSRLLELGAAADNVELFVGARRVFERARLETWLEQSGFLANSKIEREDRDGPCFVVATSAAEVGVDLDADHMASDLVAWERMVQRLGRVNRRGEGDAQVIIVHVDSPAEDAERARTAALDALLRSADASPAALLALREDETRQATLAAASTPPPLRPALSRPLVDAWSMTSLRDHTGRPEVAPWLRGWVESEPQTTVAWRTHLPVRDGAPDDASVDEFFEAAPLHLSELLEAESEQVVPWLESRVKALARSTGAETPPGTSLATLTAFVRTSDNGSFEQVRLGDLLQREHKARLVEKLKGSTLVLHASFGGLRHGLIDASSNAAEPVADAEDPRSWLVDSEGDPVLRFKVVPQDPPSDEDWVERHRFVTSYIGDEEPATWLTVLKWRHDAATEDDRGTASKAQKLDDHQSWVEVRARRIASRLDLPPEWIEALAVAGRLHDEGKRAQRWQLAFSAPTGAAYAKTRGPIRRAVLGRYRHELGSLPYAERDPRLARLSPEQRDLVLHLIAAHHGFARPLITPEDCEDGPPSTIEERVRQVALRFFRLQRQWGPWGLAWWESLLRAADQQASRELDAPKATKEGTR